MFARLFLPSTLALALLLATAMPAAAGGKPDRFPGDLGPRLMQGFCAFDVFVDHVIDRSVVTIFPETKDGSRRITSTGFVRAEATNLDTGKTVVMNVTGQLTIWFRPDGSVFVAGHGPLVAFYTTAELGVSPLGAGLFYIRGRITETYSPAGELVDASFDGHAVDLCAALAS